MLLFKPYYGRYKESFFIVKQFVRIIDLKSKDNLVLRLDRIASILNKILCPPCSLPVSSPYNDRYFIGA